MVFNGGAGANKPITFDGNISADGFVVQNGYTATMQINNGVTVTVGTGAMDITYGNPAVDQFNVNFGSLTSKLVFADVDGGDLFNFNFTGQMGTFEIQQGTVMAGFPGYTTSTAAAWQVDDNATLIASTSTTGIQFDNNIPGQVLTIQVGGELLVNDGGTGTVFDNLNNGGYLSNSGTIDVQGGKPTFAIPVLNKVGSVTVEGGSKAVFSRIVTAVGGGTADLYQADGSFTIKDNSTVTCLHSYKQDSGSLSAYGTNNWLIATNGVWMYGGVINFSTTNYDTLNVGRRPAIEGGDLQPQDQLEQPGATRLPDRHRDGVDQPGGRDHEIERHRHGDVYAWPTVEGNSPGGERRDAHLRGGERIRTHGHFPRLR